MKTTAKILMILAAGLLVIALMQVAKGLDEGIFIRNMINAVLLGAIGGVLHYIGKKRETNIDEILGEHQ